MANGSGQGTACAAAEDPTGEHEKSQHQERRGREALYERTATSSSTLSKNGLSQSGLSRRQVPNLLDRQMIVRRNAIEARERTEQAQLKRARDSSEEDDREGSRARGRDLTSSWSRWSGRSSTWQKSPSRHRSPPPQRSLSRVRYLQQLLDERTISPPHQTSMPITLSRAQATELEEGEIGNEATLTASSIQFGSSDRDQSQAGSFTSDSDVEMVSAGSILPRSFEPPPGPKDAVAAASSTSLTEPHANEDGIQILVEPPDHDDNFPVITDADLEATFTSEPASWIAPVANMTKARPSAFPLEAITLVCSSSGTMSSDSIEQIKASALIVVTTHAGYNGTSRLLRSDAATLQILPEAVRDATRVLMVHGRQLYQV